MNKTIEVIICIIVAFFCVVLCACSSGASNDIESSGSNITTQAESAPVLGYPDNQAGSDSASEEYSKNEDEAETKGALANGSNINSNNNNNNERNNDDDIDTDTVYGSISELFSQRDPAFSESIEYQEAIDAYDNILRQDIDRILEEHGGYGEPRISFGYVDDDDIPELFLGLDGNHPSGIIVFTFLSDRKDAVKVGAFSSFGTMTYIERGNRIISQYGSGGSFIHYYTEIKEGKPVALGSIAQADRKVNDDSNIENTKEDEDEVGIVYFAGYDLPKGIDGSWENEVYWDWYDETYSVSEEEYLKWDEELKGNPDKSGKRELEVKYESMPFVDMRL